MKIVIPFNYDGVLSETVTDLFKDILLIEKTEDGGVRLRCGSVPKAQRPVQIELSKEEVDRMYEVSRCPQ